MYSKPPKGPVSFIAYDSNIEISVYVTRIPIKDVPESEEGMASWLYALYEAKDKLLAHYKQHGVFPGATLLLLRIRNALCRD